MKPPRSIPILESLKFYFIFFRYIVVWGLLFFNRYRLPLPYLIGLFIIHRKLSSLFISRLVLGSFNVYFNKYLVYRPLDNGLFKREALAALFYLLAFVTFCFL